MNLIFLPGIFNVRPAPCRILGARGGATGIFGAVGGAGGKGAIGANGADGGAFVGGPLDAGGGKRILPSVEAVSFINDLIASQF